MAHFKVFVINPGSTSTKLAYFENDKKLYETNVFHDADELGRYEHINDQLPYRKEVILKFLKETGIDLHGVDAIVGRGGPCYPLPGGVYEITDLLLEDTRRDVGDTRHPSILGVQLARELQAEFGGRALMVDSPTTDEMEEVARVTGVKGVYRHSNFHALNQKGTCRHHCKLHGVKYEQGNYIVCHIDGGMSVAAHKKGRVIDTTDGARGEGPFTPTRAGTVTAVDLLEWAAGQDLDQARKVFISRGGFVSHFGTANSDTVHKWVEKGDPHAKRVWEAMIYNICKQIGAMATVLEGKVDGIVCGGGLLRFEDLCREIEERCGWIAPVSFYPGEVEQDAMAAGALRVLRGEEEPKVYTGKPVWDGFADENDR